MNLTMLTIDSMGYTYDSVSSALSDYTPVQSTINVAALDPSFSSRSMSSRRTT